MKINAVQTFGYNKKNNQTPKLNKKQEYDRITFSGGKNFTSNSQLKEFVHGLAQNCISKNIDCKKVIANYVSKFNDEAKIKIIENSFNCVDEFNQFYIHKLNFDENSIVQNKTDAKDLIDTIKFDFAESASLIKDSKLRHKTIEEFLDSSDNNVKMGARNALASIKNSPLKDKLIDKIASRENAFEMRGEAFSNFGFLLKNSTDNMQLKLIKKYIDAQGLENQNGYHIIGKEQKLQKPQNIMKLINILLPIGNFRYQRELLPLLESLPETQRGEAFIKMVKSKARNQENKVALSFLVSKNVENIMQSMPLEKRKILANILSKNKKYVSIKMDFIDSLKKDNMPELPHLTAIIQS